MKHLQYKHFFITLIVLLLIMVPTFVFGGDKVTICHYPPGNAENPNTISINENALSEHLAHGDQLGECPCPDTACPTHVKVINDSSEPVPVTGETTVSGSVGIEGTADVKVVNDSSHPVPITGETTVSGSVSIEGTPDVRIIDDKIPFQATLQCFPPSCGDRAIYRVPSDKICVVEYFSCITYFSGASTPGTALICQISPEVNGVRAQHSLPRSDSSNLYGHLSTGGMVKIYATSADILVDGYLTGGGGATFPDLWVSISGYCIDAL